MSVIQKSVTAFAPLPTSRDTRRAPLKKFSRTDNLTLWHRVTLQTVRQNDPDLTTRQLALLMSVYLDGGPHTVRSLAAQLGVTCLLYTSPSPRDGLLSRMPSSA